MFRVCFKLMEGTVESRMRLRCFKDTKPLRRPVIGTE